MFTKIRKIICCASLIRMVTFIPSSHGKKQTEIFNIQTESTKNRNKIIRNETKKKRFSRCRCGSPVIRSPCESLKPVWITEVPIEVLFKNIYKSFSSNIVTLFESFIKVLDDSL